VHHRRLRALHCARPSGEGAQTSRGATAGNLDRARRTTFDQIRQENARRNARESRKRTLAKISCAAIVVGTGLAFDYHIGGGHIVIPHSLWEFFVLATTIIVFGSLGAGGIFVGVGVLWGICFVYVSIVSAFCGYTIRFQDASKKSEEH
jgi:hypothetical protein